MPFGGMADSCCAPPPLNLDPNRGNATYRRILWTVLAINGAMFLVEIGAGLAAGSASLQADALDFFGDAANYAISLMVVGGPALSGNRRSSQGRNGGAVWALDHGNRILARGARHTPKRDDDGCGRLCRLARQWPVFRSAMGLSRPSGLQFIP